MERTECKEGLSLIRETTITVCKRMGIFTLLFLLLAGFLISLVVGSNPFRGGYLWIILGGFEIIILITFRIVPYYGLRSFLKAFDPRAKERFKGLKQAMFFPLWLTLIFLGLSIILGVTVCLSMVYLPIFPLWSPAELLWNLGLRAGIVVLSLSLGLFIPLSLIIQKSVQFFFSFMYPEIEVWDYPISMKMNIRAVILSSGFLGVTSLVLFLGGLFDSFQRDILEERYLEFCEVILATPAGGETGGEFSLFFSELELPSEVSPFLIGGERSYIPEKALSSGFFLLKEMKVMGPTILRDNIAKSTIAFTPVGGTISEKLFAGIFFTPFTSFFWLFLLGYVFIYCMILSFVLKKGIDYTISSKLKRAAKILLSISKGKALSGLSFSSGRILEIEGLFQNIEEIKRQIEIMQRLKVRAELRKKEAQRISTQFLGHITHDLKIPLNSILGFAELLLKGSDGVLNRRQREDVTIIYQNGRSLLKFIDNILYLTRIETGRMELYKEWLPPVEILSRGLAQIKQTIKNKEISFETELQPNLPLVQVDIAHLSQAISNLTLSIIGAGKRYLIKAKEKTGMPDLDPKRKYLEITITALEPNSLNKTQKGILKNFGNLNLSLSIANPEFGLGLYIARNIIELHNGKVILKEEPKDNLLWHVYLPITN